MIKYICKEDLDCSCCPQFNKDSVCSELIEVKSLEYGKWLQCKSIRYKYYCSNCTKFTIEYDDREFYKYCPNCGALMSYK